MTSTLAEAFEKGDDTNVNIEVKVMETLKREKPQNGKEYLLVRVGDATGTALLKIYKDDQFEKFEQHPSLLLINIIKKTNSFIFTKKSMASYCKSIDVIKKQDIQPQKQPAKSGTINDVFQGSNDITIKCRVIHVSPVKDRTNSYTGMPLKLRHLMVKDGTKTAKMALWNDISTHNYSSGDIIEVSNVKLATFDNRKLLGTTPKSSMQFVAEETTTNIPDVTNEDLRLAYEDADFKDCIKQNGTIRGFDQLRIYNICTKKRCMNRELKDNSCPTCNSVPDKQQKYMRATLTIEDSQTSSIINVTLFYPDYCTLCAFSEMQTTLDRDVVQENLISLIGQSISFNTRKTCITNITMKRKSKEN